MALSPFHFDDDPAIWLEKLWTRESGDELKNLMIEEIEIHIERKKVKNLNLVVMAPDGRVRISAPHWASDTEITEFARAKVDWIRKHRVRILEKAAEKAPAPLGYVSGEKLEIRGRTFNLKVYFSLGKSQVELKEEELQLTVKVGSTAAQRKKILDNWKKEELSKEIPGLLEKWEPIVGKSVSGWTIRDMKTRWGSCNIRERKICLSLQLIQKSPAFLEYVVLHELVHLLEKGHNKIFYGHLDRLMPDWKRNRALR